VKRRLLAAALALAATLGAIGVATSAAADPGTTNIVAGSSWT
jgi:hypothetical protein